MLRQSCAAGQAHLRSHAGPGSSNVLSGAPTGPEFRVCPELFRTLVLERLRLPLEVVESQCECGTPLDTLERHRAACPRSGRLRTRAGPPERTMARICREAGATVRFNTRLREMNVAVSANDERSIEVLASGLLVHHGAQLAVDVALRCALTCGGNAHPQAASTNGVVLTRAPSGQGEEVRRTPRVRALPTGGRRTGDGEGDGARKRWSSWTVLQLPAHVKRRASYGVQPSWDGGAGGAGCLPSRVPGPSLLRWWPCQRPPSPGQTAPSPDLADLFAM